MIAEPFHSPASVIRQRSSIALRFAQIAWVILVIFSIFKFALSEVVYYQGITQVCMGVVLDCHTEQQATPQDVASLQADGVSLEQWALGNIAYRTGVVLVYCTIALLIFARKRDDRGALITSLFLVMFGTLGGFGGFLAARFPEFNFWFSLIEYPAYVSLPLFFFSFPNGQIVPRIMWVFVVVWSFYFLVDFLVPGISRIGPYFELFATVAWLGMFGGGAASQIYRYLRVSNAEERRQTKWVVSGVATLFIVVIIAFEIPPYSQLLNNAWSYSAQQLLAFAIVNLSTIVIPTTIGIAIFRYRLYEIDVIIRRTLIYGVLTALLAAVYLGSVVVLQQVFRGLTGQGSDLAIIISTLAIAALFVPLRNRVQRVIDHRFYRRKYNAGQVLATFAATVRDEVDLGRLTDELQSVVEDTMQPEHVSIWIRKPRASGNFQKGGI